MALKNDPLKSRKKGFFVDVKTSAAEIQSSLKENSNVVDLPDTSSQNQEEQNSQITFHELQNINCKSQNTQSKKENNSDEQATKSEKIVFLSTRVHKSQDKWLDDTVEYLQELNRKKVIKKEALIRAAIQLLQSKNLDWKRIKSEEDLIAELNS
jgi:hypothetical protein